MTLNTHFSRRAVLAGTSLSLLGLALPMQGFAQQVSILRPRIEAALSSIQTQRGRFVQIDTESGRGVQGNFFLSRPGRMRFQYDEISEYLVSNGTHVARVNTRTGNITKTRLGSTPLRIILSEQVDLTDGVTITRMEQTPDSLFVTLYESNKRDQGLMTVFLDVNTFELRGWKIEQNDGEETTIILQDIESGVYINPTNFQIPSS